MTWKYASPLPEPARQSRLSLLQPAFLVRYVEGLRACRKVGLNVVPFETRRTEARQKWLWQQGREWEGQIVTNASSVETSWHGAGLASDSAFVNSAGDVVWQIPERTWYDFGQIMEEHGLAWGGRWKRPDSPHVQALLIPKSPSDEDQQRIYAGNLSALCTKYDQYSVSYYDAHGWAA